MPTSNFPKKSIKKIADVHMYVYYTYEYNIHICISMNNSTRPQNLYIDDNMVYKIIMFESWTFPTVKN